MRKDIKSILTSKVEIPEYMKLNTVDIQEIMSYLSSVPIKRGNRGLLAQSYLNVLSLRIEMVQESKENGVYIRGNLVPGLYTVDSLGQPVYGTSLENCTLCVPNTARPNTPYARAYMPLDQLDAFVKVQNTMFASKYIALPGKQINYPRYTASCPFVLLARKLYLNIKYSEWDRSDPGISKILPKDLVGLEKLSDLDFSPQELRQYLEMMNITQRTRFTVGPEYRTLLKLSTAVPRLIEMGLREEGITQKEAQFDSIPTELKRMFLQTWIYNAKYRTSDLILDYKDWDAVPDDIWEGFKGFRGPGTPVASSIIFSSELEWE